MDNKKKLYIMRSPPGSGKSYLAKKLTGITGGKYISSDEYLTTREVYHWSPSLAIESHSICQKLAEQSMKKGIKSIIIDNMNLRPSSARPYVDLANKYGYKVEVHEPDTPWKTDIEGLLKHGKHNVPREDLEKILEVYLRIPLDEFKKELGI